MFTDTPASVSAPRRLGRRLLGSSLLDALAAPHGVDRYLELVRPAWSLRDVRAEVVAAQRRTPDSVTLTLRPNDNWRGHRAGQFTNLTVEIDGVRRTRCYSPASSAHARDGLVELTVKVHDGGLVSRHLCARARPGLTVGLTQAEGDFVLPTTRPDALVLISGGSGITPVLSMLRTLCDEGHTGAITHLHFAPSPADVPYRAELAELQARHPNVDVRLGFSHEPAAGDLHGRLSAELLAELLPGHAELPAYVCGPPALIEGARALWAAHGAEELVHSESFLPPAPLVPAEGEAEGSVRFARSALDAANSGQTLLEQAEAAGLTPDFGCRMGICHTCTCRKAQGAVRDVRSGELSTEPDQDIQICVSVPAGDVTLDL